MGVSLSLPIFPRFKAKWSLMEADFYIIRKRYGFNDISQAFQRKISLSIFLFDTIIIELLEWIGQMYWIHLNWISEIFLWNRVTRFTKHENFITRYIWCELHKTCTSKNPAVLWIKYGFSRHWDMALFKLEVFILLATSYG